MTDTITIEAVTTEGPDPTIKIIDIRPTAAFHGWALRNEPRGCHIPGWEDVSVYDGGWFEWSRINGPSR